MAGEGDSDDQASPTLTRDFTAPRKHIRFEERELTSPTLHSGKRKARQRRRARLNELKQIFHPIFQLLRAQLGVLVCNNVLGYENDNAPTTEQLLQLIDEASALTSDMAPQLRRLKKWTAHFAGKQIMDAHSMENDESIVTWHDLKLLNDILDKRTSTLNTDDQKSSHYKVKCKHITKMYNDMVLRERVLKSFCGTLLSRCVYFEGRSHNMTKENIEKLALFIIPEAGPSPAGSHADLQASLDQFWALSGRSGVPDDKTVEKFMRKIDQDKEKKKNTNAEHVYDPSL